MHLEHCLLLTLYSLLDLFGTLKRMHGHDSAIEHLHKVTLATQPTTVTHWSIASEGEVANVVTSSGIILIIAFGSRTETFLVTTQGSLSHVFTCEVRSLLNIGCFNNVPH